MVSRTALTFDPIAEARRLWKEHGWGDAAPAMSVMTSIVRVQQIVATRIEQELRPLGLSMARYEVLMMLLFSSRGELPLGKLGARLQVQPGAITNAIDRLEADGCVQRVPHATDGRTRLARITPKGRRTARKAVDIVNREVYLKFELSRAETEALFKLLRTLRARAGDFPE